jgi:hypothetical protein
LGTFLYSETRVAGSAPQENKASRLVSRTGRAALNREVFADVVFLEEGASLILNPIQQILGVSGRHLRYSSSFAWLHMVAKEFKDLRGVHRSILIGKGEFRCYVMVCTPTGPSLKAALTGNITSRVTDCTEDSSVR